jgi:NADH-quinone oxidoreductase subunit N
MNWAAALVTLLPEHFLLLGIVLLIVVEMAAPRSRAALAVALVALVAASLAAAALWLGGFDSVPFPGQLSVDPNALLAKAMVLALAVPVLLISRDDFATPPFHTLVLSSLYGLCVLLSADSFLTLFLGLELMSLPVYALVVLAYRRPQCAEAALKYLVIGGTASATLLLGASLLYGASGSLELAAFRAALGSIDALATMAVMLVIVAFFVKAAVVPFHAWAPDAYEAASVPVTAYMAAIIKAGVLLAAVRVIGTATIAPVFLALIGLLPLVSIVWGNLVAMRQQSLRRMMAYSSIAHAGYLFYAFLGEGESRFTAIAFYLLAYGLMNILAFAALPPSADDVSRDRLENLRGLYRREPFAAIAIAIAMLSLAGIPPFPGFVAKFLIFWNVMTAGHTLYAVLGLVGSYVGIYFYLRVIQALFMSTAERAAGERPASRTAWIAGVVCLAAAALVMVFPGWVLARL